MPMPRRHLLKAALLLPVAQFIHAQTNVLSNANYFHNLIRQLDDFVPRHAPSYGHNGDDNFTLT